MQVSQGLTIVEPADLRHDAFEQSEETFGLGRESYQPFTPIHAFGLLVLVEQPARTHARLFRRQIQQRQVVAAFEVAGVILEGGAPFLVDQP